MNVHFEDESYYKLDRRGGLLYVTLPLFHAGSSSDGTDVNFILDTGAYLTVISRETALRLGYDKLPKKSTVMYGFGGGIDVDYVRIPGIKLLNTLYTDIPVLIPRDTHRAHPVSGEQKPMPEVLGLNVLEYYGYFVDTENNRLYLKENPTPRFYSPEIAGGQVFTAGDL